MRTLMMAAGVSALALLAAAGHAQEAPAAPPAEMKQLDFLLGSWKGTGTFYAMGAPATFTETFSAKHVVGGHYLMLESSVTLATQPGATGPKVVHEMLYLISWDASGRVFRIKHYASGGQIGVTTATVTDGKVVEKEKQSPFTGRGEARYSYWSTGPDSWAMLAEQSEDGTTWTKVFDQTCARAAAK